MRRRSFLKRLGGGFAAGAATGTAATSLADPRMGTERRAGDSTFPARTSAPAQSARVRKAVKFHMLDSEASIAERFRIIREAGFEGVEFRSPNDYATSEIVAAREETGLDVIGVVAGWKHFGSTDRATLEQSHAELETALQDAADYGGSICLLVPETVNADMAYDQAYEQSIREIKKALPRAEELGVRIAIENVWNNFLLSPLEFARYVDAFESEWLGAYFDIGNVVKLGWPEQWIRILGDRIMRLDVKGFSREIMDERGPGAGFEVDIGEGSVDYGAVRAALDEIEYDGFATAEETGGGADRMAEIAGQMDRVLPTS